MKGIFGQRKGSVSTDRTKIDDILSRGVEDVFVKEDLEKKLLSGKQLRIKFGIDPTSPNLHLGRAVPLRKLKAFQQLGHQIVLIIGDFTAQIGDPSDKLEKRPMLTAEKIAEYLSDYKKKLGKIVDLNNVEFFYNSKWLSKMTLSQVAELSESFSVQQMSARRNFKDRFEKGEEVSLREFLYPLMQGYDSVMVKADVEIGGFDQLFNLKAGRTIQRHYKMPEQNVLTFKMLEGTDGRKMSSSWGNVINIDDESADMFGKVMALRDELIGKYFLLCTDYSTDWIEDIENKMKSDELNPRDAKALLAKAIVAIYHGEKAAESAENSFNSVFQKGAIPEDIAEIQAKQGESLVDILMRSGVVKSKTEFRRLIEEGAVKELGETEQKIESTDYSVHKDVTLKVGKRRFVKITLK